MLGQTAEAKMEKFVDTMPTKIQTHLITCENLAKTTKKTKDLEHIIRKCESPAAALSLTHQFPACTLILLMLMIKKKQRFPNLSKGLNQSKLKIEEEGKANSNSKSQNPLQYRHKRNNTLMKIPIITTTMRIIEVN